MSGPVWRRLDDSGEQCDACLNEVETTYAIGIIESGEFYPRQHYCERCYEESRRRDD